MYIFRICLSLPLTSVVSQIRLSSFLLLYSSVFISHTEWTKHKTFLFHQVTLSMSLMSVLWDRTISQDGTCWNTKVCPHHILQLMLMLSLLWSTLTWLWNLISLKWLNLFMGHLQSKKLSKALLYMKFEGGFLEQPNMILENQSNGPSMTGKTSNFFSYVCFFQCACVCVCRQSSPAQETYY